jgi:glutamate synthase (NADPH/NADH) small chain
VVIGGGNTAIDAATQVRRLGAEDVTIVYRRGPKQMTATDKEQQWAQTNNVRLMHWAAPIRLLGQDNALTGVEFARTQLDASGSLTVTDDTFVLQADMVLKAIGQRFVTDDTVPALRDGRIAVDAERHTSLPCVYAGGDCVQGADLTVTAVQDGKLAAAAIHQHLTGGEALG